MQALEVLALRDTELWWSKNVFTELETTTQRLCETCINASLQAMPGYLCLAGYTSWCTFRNLKYAETLVIIWGNFHKGVARKRMALCRCHWGFNVGGIT